jgi:ABC-type multidrug transport system fused ATPase/permease subunit
MVSSMPLLIIAVWALQKIYLRTSRQLRLLDLEARGPLYSHFMESLSGLTTIRAFGWEEDFRAKSHEHLDYSQRPYYLLYCIQRWLNLVLDLIVGAEAVLVVGLAIWIRSSTSVGRLGVSLNNILCKFTLSSMPWSYPRAAVTDTPRLFSLQHVALVVGVWMDDAGNVARFNCTAERLRNHGHAGG